MGASSADSRPLAGSSMHNAQKASMQYEAQLQALQAAHAAKALGKRMQAAAPLR